MEPLDTQDEAQAPVPVGVLHVPPALSRWSEFVVRASQAHGVPESLLFAIISRESGGQNIRGDGGHGRGLTQIDDRFHGPWLDAHQQGMDPESNIDEGARILREAVDWFDTHQHLLPQLSDTAFRLRCAIAAYNAGPGGVLRAVRAGEDPDHFTTGGDYSRDVLRRRAEFLATPQEQP